MNGDISNLTLFYTAIGIVISVVGLQFFVVSYLFRRQDRAIERLEAKLDNSVEKLEAKLDSSEERLEAKLDSSVERLEAKLDSSVERLDLRVDSSIAKLRSDQKELENKLDHSLAQVNAKFDHLSSQMYNLNGKVNKLLGPHLRNRRHDSGGWRRNKSRQLTHPAAHPSRSTESWRVRLTRHVATREVADDQFSHLLNPKVARTAQIRVLRELHFK